MCNIIYLRGDPFNVEHSSQWRFRESILEKILNDNIMIYYIYTFYCFRNRNSEYFDLWKSYFRQE